VALSLCETASENLLLERLQHVIHSGVQHVIAARHARAFRWHGAIVEANHGALIQSVNAFGHAWLPSGYIAQLRRVVQATIVACAAERRIDSYRVGRGTSSGGQLQAFRAFIANYTNLGVGLQAGADLVFQRCKSASGVEQANDGRNQGSQKH
jgi:hypothetical protein